MNDPEVLLDLQRRGTTEEVDRPMHRPSLYRLLCLAFALPLLTSETAAQTTGASRLSLAGEWSFRLDPEGVGEKNRWFDAALPERIRLPGSLAENGKGYDISVDTRWTGQIVSKAWYTDERYARYRQPGAAKVPFWLNPRKHYVGPAWYQREVVVPEEWGDKVITLFLERCHWQTSVWVDGKAAGSQDSLSVPHRYDLSDALAPGRHRLTIRADNTLRISVGSNAHSVSDHTQTNWNGIVGRIELIALDKVRIASVQVYPNVTSRSARVRAVVDNATGGPVRGKLELRATSRHGPREHSVASSITEFTAGPSRTAVEIDYPMGPGAQLWDEFSPAVYSLSVSLQASAGGRAYSDAVSVDFGLREMGAEGTHLTINGNKRFLRGTLECCIFPLTGYPPTDVAPWLRILRIARAHGLNHLRFHSWCPPEAAFVAADRMGFTYQVECGAWTTVGDGGTTDAFIRAESDRILEAYGNHPSFGFLAYGNEPGGRNQRRFLGDLVRYWKQKDPRRLYTSAAGWPIIPESQFHSTPAPRVHAWGAGLRCRFNSREPETVSDYREFVSRYDVPVVSHEIGQWCAYPNFEEIDKYTGVLQAHNFEIFRDSLARNHMLDQARDFLMASGKLQTLCYKEEIEAALRTPGFGGFQLLDLHDFPGQGTALVGVLDAFWGSKGYVTADEYHRFSCETVPLARMKKRTWTTEEIFTAEVEIAHFGPAPLRDARPLWKVSGREGRRIASGELPATTIPLGNGFRLGKVALPLSAVEAPQALSLAVGLKGTSYENDWDFWVYPSRLDIAAPAGVLVAEDLSEKAESVLKVGGKVLLLPGSGRVRGDRYGKIPAAFSSIFWNTAWTRRQPPHTLGFLCDPNHPALARFPTESHSNWQWWDLVTKSQIMILDRFPPTLRPLVQVIDDWFTNRRLGLVFEAVVHRGKLVVCSIDVAANLEGRPVARQFRHSLLEYMESAAFEPKASLEAEEIRSLFAAPPAMVALGAKVVHADSQAPGFEAGKAIDGDALTLWHTEWEGKAPDFPHELQIDLRRIVEIEGFRYLPRQDMTNGWIAGYEFYVSADGRRWGPPAAKGVFAKGRAAKEVVFAEAAKGRFIRFVARSAVKPNDFFASVAELDLIVR